MYKDVLVVEINCIIIILFVQFDGVHIVSGSLDTSIRVWDVETGNCLHTLVGHQSLTSGMELKDNILVSGNADSTIKVWDITTGLCLQTLQGEWITTALTRTLTPQVILTTLIYIIQSKNQSINNIFPTNSTYS